jgi:F-type H+-transporting ATPase subunit delta
MITKTDPRIARRYAAALFQSAQKQGKLDTVERDMRTMYELTQMTPMLSRAWRSPEVPPARKREMVRQILGDSADPMTLSFLRLLVDKRREAILTDVWHEMHRLADAAHHLLRAEALFAIPPTPEELEQLRLSLQQRTGENVELAVRVAPGILGGVIVRMGDTVIDGSVRGNLERLREQLLQEA